MKNKPAKTMKQILTLVMATGMAVAALGQPYVWNSTNNVAGGTIPDDSLSGNASTIAVSGLADVIKNVSVTLDITGGYNGDLYAYLAGPNAGFAVLLNRAGVNGGSAYGYGDTGFNVTLDDSASNPDIHTYQTTGYPGSLNGSGQLTGTWGSDGESIDPQSAPSAFNAGSGSATLETFQNLNGNGTWTLFLADLASPNQSTIVSWTLDITTVPEPSSLALGALGIAALWQFHRSRKS
jgi:subtilisin-like proprotein convertase family protein